MIVLVKEIQKFTFSNNTWFIRVIFSICYFWTACCLLSPISI